MLTQSTTGQRPAQTSASPPKQLRVDGQQARQRLLDAGLALFAAHGYAETSTREIALTAQVNVAAISYYFGDKEGLYRAVYNDPRHNLLDATALTQAGPDIEAALRAFLTGMVDPLKRGDLMQQCIKLHYQEMLHPTGVWQDDIEHNIKPSHLALVQALCQHLQLTQAD